MITPTFPVVNSAAAPPQTPYVGLVPYAAEDAPFFFGRDAERDLIIDNLRAARMTLLYGPSGVGKSSLLCAGVVHKLRECAGRDFAEYGAPEFAVVYFSEWSKDPIEGLAAAVQAAVGKAMQMTHLDPPPPSHNLSRILQTWTERFSIELLIILDQFEEYFVYWHKETGDGTFAAEFPRA